MVEYAGLLTLVGYAVGTLGGALLFVEFFQLPSYISFDTEWETWNIDISPTEVDEYTAAGRAGALLIALSFALQFVAALL